MRHYLIYIFLSAAFLGFQGCSPAKTQDDCGYVQNVYGERISWKGQLPIVLHIHSSLSGSDKKYAVDAIRSAAETWNKAAGKTVFKIADGFSDADPNKEDRINTIAFADSWDKGLLSEQAKTAVHWIGDQIQEADIKINASKSTSGSSIFSFYSDETSGDHTNKVNIEALVLHEMGHVLGLKHKDRDASVMATYLPSGDDRTNLAATDTQSLQCEY